MKSSQLKVERELRCWSQAKLAELLGTSIRTVGRWERGEGVPYPYHREQLCLLFGKSAHELGILPDTDEKSLEIQAPDIDSSSLSTWASLLIDPAIPCTLSNVKGLFGRDELLMQAKERLFTGDNLAFTGLGGLPGIGKTALAVALAMDPQVHSHFDGILWAGLGPHPNVLGQLARWGKLLGVLPSQVKNLKSRESWNQALHAIIGDRQLLLIIDDAWTAQDALAFQVGGPGCTHLVITRYPQVATAFAEQEAIIIPQLKKNDGLALLARFVPQLVEQDPEGAQALVQAVDNLPLTLILMGNYLTSQSFTPEPLRAALAKLYDTEQRLYLDMPTTPEQPLANLAEIMPLSLHATIAMCDQQLSPQAHNILCVLTTFLPQSDTFSEQAILAVSQQPVEALDELLDAGLLESCRPGSYRLQQTIASYARAQSKGSTVLQQGSNSLVRNFQTHEWEMHSPEDDLSSHRSLWNIGIGSMRSLSTFRPFNRFSWHPRLNLFAILFALLAIIIIVPAFTLLPFLKSVQVRTTPLTQTLSPIVPLTISYEAESQKNMRIGKVKGAPCEACSGGHKVGKIGNNSALQFNKVHKAKSGDYKLTIYYVNGEADRSLYMSVNGGPGIVIHASGTNDGNWKTTVQTISITVHLNAGDNTIKFFNPAAPAPDIDRIVV